MRNVIVTGGSRGLGLGIAQKLAAAGYCVIAIARSRSDALARAIEDSAAAAGSLRFKPFDLTQTAELRGFVKEIRDDVGPIYGLVNNAGLGTGGLLATMQDADIERLLRLNTLSVFLLTKYVLRSMMADAGGGRIVNMSSIVSHTGYKGLSVYSATKSALLGFTRSLAREVGPLGITVNAVAPGFIDTEMTEGMAGTQRDKIARRSALRRLAGIDDVANAVAFLLGDEAKNITATTLTVDAGSTA